ncbi:MAG: hypothetical protein QOK48_3661 [Blastocatellia bacterium]|nr:hypothetical protein [Blastocatellia bacterium]
MNEFLRVELRGTGNAGTLALRAWLSIPRWNTVRASRSNAGEGARGPSTKGPLKLNPSTIVKMSIDPIVANATAKQLHNS